MSKILSMTSNHHISGKAMVIKYIKSPGIDAISPEIKPLAG